MNSFNDIKRIKYLENKESVVSLSEYVIFADERKHEKFIVFKFLNNLNQVLHAVRFEIVQYDKDNNVIEKNIIKYNKVAIGENDSFIPNNKLRVQFSCVKISANLLYAHFTNSIFEYGQFKQIPISFDDYKNDVPLSKTKREIKRDIRRAKLVEKTAVIQQRTTARIRSALKQELYSISDGNPSRINRKNAFQIKNVKNRCKPFIPRLIGLACAVIFFVMSFTYIFNFATTDDVLIKSGGVYQFSVGDFDYSRDGVVTRYYGQDQTVTINDSAEFKYNKGFGYYVDYVLSSLEYSFGVIKEKPVLEKSEVYTVNLTKIGDRAFAKSVIKEIVLPQSIVEFENEAFVNSVNLSKITYEQEPSALVLGKYALSNTAFQKFNYDFVTYLDEYSLSNCYNLKKVNVDNAIVCANAFTGCNNIETLSFDKTSVNKLSDLFGGQAPQSLKTVKINMKENKIPDGFLSGFKKKNIKLYLNGEVYSNSRLFNN